MFHKFKFWRSSPVDFWPAYADLFVGFSAVLLIFFMGLQRDKQVLDEKIKGVEPEKIELLEQNKRLRNELELLKNKLKESKAELAQYKTGDCYCCPEEQCLKDIGQVVQPIKDVLKDLGPITEKGDEVGGFTFVLKEEHLAFPTGSCQINAEYQDRLESIGDGLTFGLGKLSPENRAKIQIEIIGYTDAEPSRRTTRDNWDLSYKRAKSVMEFFESECSLYPARSPEGSDVCSIHKRDTALIKVIGVADTFAEHRFREGMTQNQLGRWRETASTDRRMEIRIVPNLQYFQNKCQVMK